MVDSLKMYQRYELKDKNRKDILDNTSLYHSVYVIHSASA